MIGLWSNKNWNWTFSIYMFLILLWVTFLLANILKPKGAMPPPYLTHKKVCIRPNQLDVENNTHRYMYCSQPMGQTVDYIWNSGEGLTWFCPGSAGLMIIGAEKELIIMRRTWKWELNNNGLHCSSGAKMSLSYDLHPLEGRASKS